MYKCWKQRVGHSMEYVDMHRHGPCVQIHYRQCRPGPVFDKPWPGRCTHAALLCRLYHAMPAFATSKELTSQSRASSLTDNACARVRGACRHLCFLDPIPLPFPKPFFSPYAPGGCVTVGESHQQYRRVTCIVYPSMHP